MLLISWISFYSYTSIIAILSGICIPETRGIYGASYCWCCQFHVLQRIEADIDDDDCCEKILYPTVLFWFIDVCNNTLLALYGGMLTVGG